MVDKEKLRVVIPTPVNLPSERGPSPAQLSLGGPLESSKDKDSESKLTTDYFEDDL